MTAEIKELYRQRVDLHNAEKRLTLQMRAVCRRLCGGDRDEADHLYDAMMSNGTHAEALTAHGYCLPLIAARDAITPSRRDIEKRMEKLAKTVSVWQWVEGVKGVSAMTLAQIVGEAGDLTNYASPAKLWKRMGLAVIDNERQRRVAGDAEKAIEHGYNARRRSIIWNMGECIVKAQVRRDKETGESAAIGDYGQLYLDRREYERGRVESLAHANNRAKRYMTKRVLRDMWRAWRDVTVESSEAA